MNEILNDIDRMFNDIIALQGKIETLQFSEKKEEQINKNMFNLLKNILVIRENIVSKDKI